MRWSRSFEYLLRYVDKEGHSNVPEDYITEEGFRLGAWVYKQRVGHTVLSNEAKQALEDLPGWIWNLRQFNVEKNWFKAFEHLRSYVDKEGHARVPKDYITEDGFNLGAWIKNQRSAYKRKELSVKAKKTLEDLPGWMWNLRQFNAGKNWLKAFEHLSSYVDKEGHARVPKDYITEDGFNLGAWVKNQRSAYKRKELSVKAKKTLEDLPGWIWNLRQFNAEKNWFKAFEYLRSYVDKVGHARVPNDYVTGDNYHLGAWVNLQRQLYKQRRLTKNQELKLEKLKGWVWSIDEVKWFEGFEYLQKYVKREGNALVSRRYVQRNGYRLGLWVMTQRQRFRQNRLPKKYREALKKLPGWVWNAQIASQRGIGRKWNENMEHLRKYVKKEGHANVPAKYNKRWPQARYLGNTTKI